MRRRWRALLYERLRGAAVRQHRGGSLGPSPFTAILRRRSGWNASCARAAMSCRSILEAVPDQVIVYDTNLRLIRSNAAHRAAEQRYYPGEPPLTLCLSASSGRGRSFVI